MQNGKRGMGIGEWEIKNGKRRMNDPSVIKYHSPVVQRADNTIHIVLLSLWEFSLCLYWHPILLTN